MLLLNQKDIRIELDTHNESMSLRCLHFDQKNIINISLHNAAVLENNTDDRFDGEKFERSVRFCPLVSDTRKRSGVVSIEMNGALLYHFSWMWANNSCTILLPPPKKRKEFTLVPLGRAVSEVDLPFFNKTLLDISPVEALIATNVRTDGSIKVSQNSINKNPKNKWLPFNCILLSALVNERGQLTKNVTIMPCKTQGGFGIQIDGKKDMFMGWFWNQASDSIIVKDIYDDEAQYDCNTAEWDSIFDEEYIASLEESIVELRETLAREEAQSIEQIARSMRAADFAFEPFDVDDLEQMGADMLRELIDNKNKELESLPLTADALAQAREMKEINITHLVKTISDYETAIAKFRAK